MYRVYADDPQARINLGIRRRLAPLLGNDRRRDRADERAAVLAAGHAGHLLRRRDRHGRQHLPRRPQRRAHADAVEPDRNAGFSRANPQQLYLPVDHRSRVPLRGGQRRGAAGQPALAALVDEAPDRACASATARSAAARSSSSRPRTARCSPSCAATRTSAILVVGEPLALRAVRRARPAPSSEGMVPGRAVRRAAEFPPIGERRTSLTLGPHGFYWFSLEPARDRTGRRHAAAVPGAPRWRGTAGRQIVERRDAPRELERRAARLPAARGAGSPASARPSAGVAVGARPSPCPAPARRAGYLRARAGRVHARASPRPTCCRWCAARHPGRERPRARRPTSAIAATAATATDGAATTRCRRPGFATALLLTLIAAASAPARRAAAGRSRATPARELRRIARRRRGLEPQPLGAEQSQQLGRLRPPGRAEALPPGRAGRRTPTLEMAGA